MNEMTNEEKFGFRRVGTKQCNRSSWDSKWNKFRKSVCNIVLEKALYMSKLGKTDDNTEKWWNNLEGITKID